METSEGVDALDGVRAEEEQKAGAEVKMVCAFGVAQLNNGQVALVQLAQNVPIPPVDLQLQMAASALAQTQAHYVMSILQGDGEDQGEGDINPDGSPSGPSIVGPDGQTPASDGPGLFVPPGSMDN